MKVKYDESNKILAKRKDSSRYEPLGTIYSNNGNYLENYSSGGYKVKRHDADAEYNGMSGYLHDNIY